MPLTELKLVNILNEVGMEMDRAMQANQPMASLHEGYSVILEEVDELWDEVKKNPRKHADRVELARKEAIQIAAMAVRLVYDVCDRE